MFLRLARIFVLIAAVQILGGHWAVLQTVAWSGMFLENVQRATLGEAVRKTFDGSKPCKLCVAVRDGRAKESREAAPRDLVKLEAIIPLAVRLPEPVSKPCVFASEAIFRPLRVFSPPTPPPRFS